MLARAPKNDATLQIAGDFFLRRGNYARAAAMRRLRVELDPKNPRNAYLHADLGTTLLFTRDFAAARRAFTDAEALAPADTFAQEGLVWSYFLEGRFAEAAKAAADYKASVAGASPNPVVLGYLSLLRLGHRAEAESWLKDRVAEFAGSTEGHILLLSVQGRVGAACKVQPPPATDGERAYCLYTAITGGPAGSEELENTFENAPNDKSDGLGRQNRAREPPLEHEEITRSPSGVPGPREPSGSAFRTSQSD